MTDIKRIRRLRRYLESKLGKNKCGPPETWTDDEVREFAELQRYIHEEEFGLTEKQREQLIADNETHTIRTDAGTGTNKLSLL